MDREKVIKGLEYCAASCKGAWEDNNGCPYMSEFCKKCLNDNEYNGRCIDLLCADALALLKAQEPRVMVAEDIRRMIGTPVWLETQSKRVYNGWALVYDIQRGQGITGERMGITQPSGRVSWFPKMPDYGKTWRLWTSRPDQATREAVKWDG